MLNNNKLVKLPDNIQDLTQLELLTIANNNLTELPKDIDKLTGLKTLILTGNNINTAEKERIKKALPGCKVYF